MSVWMGKVAVTALSITVLAALMRADAPVLNFCIWVATGLLAYSFILYIIRWVGLMRAGALPGETRTSVDDDPSVNSMHQEAGHAGG
jgi:uncharacterized protein involved in response to NO